MKRKFTFLISAAIMLLAMMATTGTMWGQTRGEEVAYTLDGTQTGGSNGYATESEITQDNVTWMVTGNTTMNPWRIGGKNLKNVDRPAYSTSAFSDDITKVVVTNGTATATVNAMTLIVSSNSNFSEPTSTISGSWAASSTTTFTKPDGADWSNKYFKLLYNVTAGNSNQYAQLVKIELYKEVSGNTPSISAEDVELAFDATGGDIEYTINNPVTGGELTAEVTFGDWLDNLQVGETVTFNCDPNQAAAARNATVTLTYTYSAKETVTKNVTVTQAGNPDAPGTQNNPYTVAQARAAIDAGTGTQGVYATGIISQVDSYNSNYFSITYWISSDGTTASDQLEVYSGKGLDNTNFSSINDVEVGATVVVYGTLKKYGEVYEFDKNNYLTSYTAPTHDVEAPTFSPAAGTYAEAQTVTMSCTTDGAAIHYTTDGTEPDGNSNVYTTGIEVSETTTFKAKAIKGNDASNVVTATYHICSAENPYTVAQALAFLEYPTSTIWVHGIVSTAPTQDPTSSGQLTYYISADGTATNQLQVYKGKGLNEANFTAQDDIQVGDIVTIYGNVVIYNNTKEFAQNNYLVSFERPVVPSISADNVNIEYSDEEGEIVYTINNPVEGGVLTADTEADWLILDDVDETVPFYCDVNTTTTALTAIVTLTYTYNTDQTVTKDVTVTQGAAPSPKIAVASTLIEVDHNEHSNTLNVTYTMINLTNAPTVFLCDSEGTAASYDWFEAEINSDKNVYYIIGANDGEARTAYFKVKGKDLNNNDVYSDIVTVYQAAHVVDYAALPFNWAGGASADFLALAGCSASALSSDYAAGNAPYLIKFDANGKYLQVKTDSRPELVTIGVKMIGGGNTSTITVKASVDGETFDDGEALTISGSQNDIVNLETTRSFGSDVRYIKMVFTKGSNVGVGPISITKYVPTYAINLNQPQQGQGTIASDKAEAVEGETVTLTATPNTGYAFDSWTVLDGEAQEVTVTNNAFVMPASDVTVEATFTALPQYDITIPAAIEDYIMVDATGNKAYAGETVTISIVDTPADKVLSTLTVTGGTSGDEIEISPEVSASVDEYTFEMPAENVTINATFGDAPKYTITFYVNGIQDGTLTIDNITPGNSVNLPASSTLTPTGFSLVGWATEGSTVAVANPYTPANSMALYALLQNENAQTTYSYVKVTEPLTDWSGDYLIVYTTGNLAFDGSLETLDASSNTIAVTITDNSIAANATTDASKFTIASCTGGYSIQSASGYYIGQTGNSNGMAVDDETVYVNSISIDDGNATITSADAYMRYNSNSGQERFRYFKSATYSSQKAIQLYKRTANDVPSFNTITEVSGTTTIGDDIPATTCVIVEDGAVLTFNGENQGTAANFIIEDGGQVIVNNAGIQATFKKSVSHGASKDAANWYTISSPVNNIAPGAVTNLIQDPATNYDLYLYDEASAKWLNQKKAANSALFTTLTNGRGYLYWNAGGDELAFAGTLNSGKIEVPVTVGESNIAGWNLIGNPYSHNIYKGTGTAILNSIAEGYVLTTGFYTLSNDGTWTAGTDNTTAIKPGQGILVKATTAGTITMTNTTASSAKSNNEFIKFIVANSNFEDVTYALFEKEKGLPKIDHRNADAPMVYIPQNGINYAIATMGDDTEMFNLNFKAMTTGQYTLRVDTKGNYSYLHIYDKMTNEDVDMLLEGEYSFIGSPRDNENRFIVRLNYNANIDELTTSDIFAYQSGDDIIVNGKGELQVFDVNGRMVMNTVINGKQTVNVPTTGLYIFRMIGESVKTQKIVVR